MFCVFKRRDICGSDILGKAYFRKVLNIEMLVFGKVLLLEVVFLQKCGFNKVAIFMKVLFKES